MTRGPYSRGSSTAYQLRTAFGGTCLDIMTLSHKGKTRVRNPETGHTGYIDDGTLRALLESKALSLHLRYRGSWQHIAGRVES